MARRKVAPEWRAEDIDALVLDNLFRDPNPMDHLAADIEAGEDRDDLGRRLP